MVFMVSLLSVVRSSTRGAPAASCRRTENGVRTGGRALKWFTPRRASLGEGVPLIGLDVVGWQSIGDQAEVRAAAAFLIPRAESVDSPAALTSSWPGLARPSMSLP
jgi:hypothetical protein